MSETFHSFSVKNANGEPVDLGTYKGKVVLAVNVASRCGFTNQYKGLEELYKKFQSRGLMILGFPCNQFGGQEPGSDHEIQDFCQLNFGVTFPVLGKIDVNGSDQAPVYQFLKAQAPGVLGTEAIKWNFTKFLISPEGKVLNRYAPQTKPEEIAPDIEALLK